VRNEGSAVSSHAPQRYSFRIAAMTAFIGGLQVIKFRPTSPAEVHILSQGLISYPCQIRFGMPASVGDPVSSLTNRPILVRDFERPSRGKLSACRTG
jgi:hypothetical protein